jgi:outer membrane receptor protein involved in Fe transport
MTYAGTTGKIKGKVTDKQSGEALIGANVSIRGTSAGASTNVDGEFIILNVTAGTYEVTASYIGYQQLRVSNVQVNADLTSEQNFALTSTAEGVAMQEIVVQRERELVNKNATNAVRIQTGEDITNLPVRDVSAAVVLNPGVVQQDGQIFIRGGRADEVGYYLEGTSTRNVLGRGLGSGTAAQIFGTEQGENLTRVIPEALEEFQVQAGGYTAQYGGANAGIIRQTLRSGTSDYKLSLLAETDNFTSQFKQRLGTYSYGYSSYVLTLSGPVLSDRIKFFLAGENRFDRDWRVQFWQGFRFENLPDRASFVNPLTGGPSDTVRVLEVKDGNIPGMFRNRWTGNGTLTLDFSPITVRFGGAFTRQKQQGTALVVEEIFDLARQPITESSDLLANTKLTYVISPTVLAEANIGYGDNRTKRYDPNHGDNFLRYNDSLANAPFGYQYRSYSIGPTDYNLYGFPFRRFGANRTTFLKEHQTRITGSLDLTAQMGSIHEFRAGGSIESFRVRRFSSGTGMLTWYRNNPDDARTPSVARDYQVRRNANVNNYGYDVYGNKIDKLFDTDDPSTIDGAKQPLFAGAYLQDKIEYQDLIINAGLRFDYFDMNDFRFIDDPTTPSIVEGPENPSVDATTFEYRPTGILKKQPFKSVSPRLGFAFPVSDRTVFHVQYGKFVQAPALNDLYTGRGNQAVSFTGGNFIPSPVGRDLDPERTTQYEIGFRQQLTDNAAFDITGFYKDIEGQIQLVRQATVPGSVAAGYNTLVNGDFATTKGVELSLTLRRSNRIQAQINYTFSDAKGTGSTVNAAVSSVENGTLYPTVISPLDFNQTHRGAVNIDYRFGEGDGGPILQRLGLNMLFTFNSGHPFTLSSGSPGQQGPETGALVENDPRASNPREAVGASTTPWNFNFDLRFDKSVSIGPLEVNFYLYIQNVLDTRNVLNVYRRTGNADDDGYLTNPDLSGAVIESFGPRYVEMFRAINLENGQHYKNVTGNDLWGSPRQMRFGVKLEL